MFRNVSSSSYFVVFFLHSRFTDTHLSHTMTMYYVIRHSKFVNCILSTFNEVVSMTLLMKYFQQKVFKDSTPLKLLECFSSFSEYSVAYDKKILIKIYSIFNLLQYSDPNSFSFDLSKYNFFLSLYLFASIVLFWKKIILWFEKHSITYVWNFSRMSIDDVSFS